LSKCCNVSRVLVMCLSIVIVQTFINDLMFVCAVTVYSHNKATKLAIIKVFEL